VKQRPIQCAVTSIQHITCGSLKLPEGHGSFQKDVETSRRTWKLLEGRGNF